MRLGRKAIYILHSAYRLRPASWRQGGVMIDSPAGILFPKRVCQRGMRGAGVNAYIERHCLGLERNCSMKERYGTKVRGFGQLSVCSFPLSP